MKRMINLPIKSLVASLLMICAMLWPTEIIAAVPSAKIMTASAITTNPSPDLSPDDLEAEKAKLQQGLEYSWYELMTIYKELEEKATEEEAPELYSRYDELRQVLNEVAQRIDNASTEEEIAVCRALLEQIAKELTDFRKEVEAFEVTETFTATTVEGIEMTFMVISEEEKTCQVGPKPTNNWSDPVAIDKATPGHVTIPAVAKGYHVTVVGEDAFRECWEITSVEIPSSVETIKVGAFQYCKKLASVNIPNSVTSIGAEAFLYCALTSVVIPSSVTELGAYYSHNVFKGCPNIQSIVVEAGNEVFDSRDNCNAIIKTSTDELYTGCKNTTIPASVNSITDYAFYGCSGLSTLTIPQNIQYIGSQSFSMCENLSSIQVESGNPKYDSRNGCNAVIETSSNKLVLGCNSTMIPEDVTTIGKAAFKGSGIVSLAIPNNIKTIEEDAFLNCGQLASVKLPEGLTEIGFGVLCGCGSLKSIDIPKSVTRIGSCAFQESGLESIVIPDNVTTIAFQAFVDCYQLKEVTIGAGVTTIGHIAFYSSTNIRTIKSYIQEPFAFEDYAFGPGDDVYTQATLYVPASTKAKYEATDGWSKFQNIVEMEDETDEMVIPDEAIDLGLPSGTKWAPWNVGASKPEDYGGYYAWGETEEKDVYDWSTYIHCDGSEETCHDIGSDIAGTQYDVAHVKWSGSWTMPTQVQVNELLDNCISEWTTVNGVNGLKFSGPNGNSIFLPAAGGRLNEEFGGVGSHGHYWSSTLNGYFPHDACYLLYFSSYAGGDGMNRYYGLTVRPVIASEPEVESVPYALWCEGNTTLYFVSSSTELKRGCTFDGQTITNVWSGETLTNTPENEDVFRYTPMPWSGINRTCTRIVFDQSFKDVRVKSTSAWIGSNVESIEGLEYLNTSEVTSMSYMFSCKNLKTIDLSHFDTHNVKYMHSMFERCSSLTELDLSNFDTKNVETMSFMFSECSALTNLDLSSFETGNVTDMQKMFAVIDGESNLKSIDMSHFDTSKATNMYAMFYGCSNLEALDLSSFNTSNVTNMEMMFSQCSSLKTIYVGRGWSTQNVEEGRGMFGRCVSLVGGQGTTFDGIHYDYTYAHIDGGADNPGYFTAKDEMVIPDEAIDLGLPSGTKWAPWNVGASKPEDYGGYYAWGETEEKDVYDWSTYIYCDGSEETCHDIGTNIAGTKYDVAHVVWGGSWKMPTWDQVKELFDNCTSEWTTVNGINGRKFTSKINGNSIFLPAAGRHDVSGLYGDGWYGFCWSSSLGSNPNLARDLSFGGSSFAGWGNYYHFYGQSVRPVIEGNKDIDPLEEDETIDFGDESGIDEQTNLDGNIVGNLYFNISNENGGYNADEDCIVINKSTSEEQMAAIEDKSFFDPDLREQFTGFIFKIPAGSGTLKITAETTGNLVLKVKIASGAPIEMELEGKLKVSFPYNVTDESYVYIYAGENSAAGVKGLNDAYDDASSGELKIYGIELKVNEDGIRSMDNGKWKMNNVIYNLSGQRLSKPQRGVNIVDGKKVVVK